MNFLLISSLENISFGEAMLFMVIGMLIIIAVLSILVGLLYVIRYVVEAMEKNRKQEKATVETPRTDIETDDDEVIAAITAAIICIMQNEIGGEVPVAPFKIKKIKHIH